MEPLPLARIQARMRELHEWALEGDMIVKDFLFPDFANAIAFVTKVAEIAEGINHHPSILITFNTVRLSLTSHDASGLTDRDFDAAQAIDALER
ncbi:4a-hydroxytetrahydrobiopterin dehydratase [Candidatus Pacearchaeota archaeon]|nr:4a-hydroxytetrahydrobiopterin dehydratase [Candidatus Pacearchaeota archaeon]